MLTGRKTAAGDVVYEVKVFARATNTWNSWNQLKLKWTTLQDGGCIRSIANKFSINYLNDLNV